MISAVQAHAAAPPPLPDATSVGASPEARLLVLMVQNQLVSGTTAQTSVKLNEEQIKQLREQIKEALNDAKNADEKSGFWGDISDVMGGDVATIAEVVAIGAAALVTGGAAAVIIGAVVIGCTLASHYAEDLGIDPKVAVGLGIAAALGSLAMGNVGGAASATSGAAAAGSTASSAANVGNGAAQVSNFAQGAHEVEVAASYVSAGASGAGAVAGGTSRYFHGRSVDYHADATAARAHETLTNLDTDTAIDAFGKAVDDQLALIQQTQAILEAKQHSNQLILQGFQGTA